MIGRRLFIAGAIVSGRLALAKTVQPPSFEAASIKPSNANPGSSGIDTENGLLRAYNVTLKRCIVGAYGIPEAQIIGGLGG